MEVEVKDFCFRQHRKINIGDPGLSPTLRYSLLCVSNEFGLTFVGCNNGVYMFETAILYSVDRDEAIGSQNVMADVSCLSATHVPTPSPPQHIALSCDNLTLSVCLQEGPFLKCLFYDVISLTKKGSPFAPFCSIALTTEQGTQLCGLRWNPATPELLAVCLSNGVLQLLTVKDDVSVTCNKTNLHANTICWSPKGKQLAVGLRDGVVLQLSPKNFEQKKSHPCPMNGEPHQVSDVHWISSHMFAVIYMPRSQDDVPSFVFLIANKNTAPVFVNFEDVFYGSGSKMNKFYFSYISKWNVLVASSANAVESAVFGQDGEGETGNWAKWELEDTGRAEMPLDDNNDDTFVAGAAIDFTSTEEVLIRDTLMLPPSPLLLLYSDRGILCPFTVINVGSPLEVVKLLVSPPKPLPAAPIRQPVVQGSGNQQQAVQTQQQQVWEESAKQVQQPGSSGLLSSLQPSETPRPMFLQTTLAATPSGSSHLTGLNLGGNKLGSAASGQPRFPFSVSSITGASAEISQQGKSSVIPGGQPTMGPGLFTQLPSSQASQGGLAGRFKTDQLLTGLLTTRTTGAPSLTIPSTQQVPPLTTQSMYSRSQSLPPPKPAPTLGGPSSRLPAYPLTPALQPNLPQATPPVAGGAQRMATQLPGQPPLASIQSPKLSTGLRLEQPPPNVVFPQGLQSVPKAILNQSAQLGMPPLHSSTPILPGPGSQPQPGSKPPPSSQLYAAQPSTIPRTVPVALQPQSTTLPATASKSPPKPYPATVQPERIPAGQTPPTRAHPVPTPGATPRRDYHQSADAERIEAGFSGHIQDEIYKFVDELESLKEGMQEVFGKCKEGGQDTRVEGLGSMKDMQELQNETQETQETIEGIVMRMKDLDIRSGQLGDEILRGWELSEEAKARMKKKDDPNYTALLKLRPLDAYNQRRLSNIRSTFLQTEHSLNEVNSQLDAEMERRYDARRQSERSPMRTPSLQTIYSSLRNNRKIIRMQNANIGQVAKGMKKLRLIPQSWHPSDAIAFQSPPAAAREITTTPSLSTSTWLPEETVAKQQICMTPEKLEQLRDHLDNIKKTPVRRVELSTRFQSRVTTPSQSSQCSGRETPLSSNPEGPASYIDSDMASTTEELYPKTATLPNPPHVQYSTRTASFPQSSLQSLSSYDLIGTTPHPVDTIGQGPLQPPPPHLHHYPIQHVLHASSVITAPPSGPLVSQPSTSSLPSQPDVIVGADKQMKVRTPEGYKFPGPPSPPVTVQSSTGSVMRVPSINHPHTVNWGTPPPTSVPEQPTPVTNAPLQALGSLPGGTSGLTRSNPLFDLTKIQSPLSVSTAVPSPPAPTITTVQPGATSQTAPPFNWSSPAFSLSLPGNLAMPIKPASDFSEMLLGIATTQKSLPSKAVPSKQTASPATTSGSIFSKLPTFKGTSPFQFGPSTSSGNSPHFSFSLGNMPSSTTATSSSLATTTSTSSGFVFGNPSTPGIGSLSSTTATSSSLATTTPTSSGFVFGNLSTPGIGSLSSVPTLRPSGPLKLSSSTAPPKGGKDGKKDESPSPGDPEKSSPQPSEETTSSALATGGGRPIPQGPTIFKPADTTGGLFDTASSKSIPGISKPNATALQKPSDVRAEQTESNGGQQTEIETELQQDLFSNDEEKATGKETTVKAVTEAESSTKSDTIPPPGDGLVKQETPVATDTSSATALPSSALPLTFSSATVKAPTGSSEASITQATAIGEVVEGPQASIATETSTVGSAGLPRPSIAAATQAQIAVIPGVPQTSIAAEASTISTAGVPQTSVAAGVPQTSIAAGVPQTSIAAGVPQTSIAAGVPQTSIAAGVPQTSIAAGVPQTSIAAGVPQTSIAAGVPQTSIAAGVPQTSIAAGVPQTSIAAGIPQTSIAAGVPQTSIAAGVPQTSIAVTTQAPTVGTARVQTPIATGTQAPTVGTAGVPQTPIATGTQAPTVGTAGVQTFIATGTQAPTIGTAGVQTFVATGTQAPTVGTAGVQTFVATGTQAPTIGTAGVQTFVATGTQAPTIGTAGVQTFIATGTQAPTVGTAGGPPSDITPQLSLLGAPLSGSRNSLQSAEVDELEMGEMENDVEPIEINDQPQQQQQQQQPGGGLFSGGLSFGGMGLGGSGPSNTTANPFGSFPTSQTSSSGPISTRVSSSGSSFIRPASGSFSSGLNMMGQMSQQQQQQPSVLSSGFGSSPLFGGTAFGSGGSGLGQPLNVNALGGRTFGTLGSVGVSSGESFQQPGGELSFGGLAQQQSGGFSSGGFSGQSMGNTSLGGGSSPFGGWRN